ncbi:hypothetical protein [Salinibius halmophilus]|nr:hypothetical protein [Salinibius halmophilus]
MKNFTDRLANLTIFNYPLPFNLDPTRHLPEESEAEMIDRLSR